MNQTELLTVICKQFPEIERDIEIAHKLYREKKTKHAAEKYKDAARRLYVTNLKSESIYYYSIASQTFIEGNYYLKAINTEITISNIHKLEQNALELANCHEKIASYYKHYLKDFNSAGFHYLSSAKYHEKDQNYRSAFKKAQFASKCFEKINYRSKIIDSNSLAFRMALQSEYIDKAGEHLLIWHKHIKKDYTSHYLSVCQKGYKTFKRTEKHNKTLFFLQEIIAAHFEKNIHQFNIENYLIESQKYSLLATKKINKQLNTRIIEQLKKEKGKIANYSHDLSQFAGALGLDNISDFFYVQRQKYRQALLWSKRNYAKFLVYKSWQATCLYGISIFRWFIVSAIIVLIFGVIYSGFPCPNFYPEWLKELLISISPEFEVSNTKTLFSSIYFSITTFTTLGLGDISPTNIAGQIFTVIEVVIGYLMLGGLITIFSKKIVR